MNLEPQKPKGCISELRTSSEDTVPITCSLINFKAHNLPEYADRYALVIDNLFTLADCAHLLSYVPTDDAEPWPGVQLADITDNLYRNSGRISVENSELAAWILDKIRPYLREVDTVDAHLHKRLRKARVKQTGDSELAPTKATISRLRELHYLRYGPGHYFRRHADGTHMTDDENEIFYFTLQLYLNGDAETLKGGATRFWPNPRFCKGSRNAKERDSDAYVDIEPRMGRVLVFEQGTLVHSGEEVTHGVKYTIRSDFLYKETEPSTIAQT